MTQDDHQLQICRVFFMTTSESYFWRKCFHILAGPTVHFARPNDWRTRL